MGHNAPASCIHAHVGRIVQRRTRDAAWTKAYFPRLIFLRRSAVGLNAIGVLEENLCHRTLCRPSRPFLVEFVRKGTFRK